MRKLLSTGPHVTLRFFRLLIGSLMLLLALAPAPSHASEGVEIRRYLVESTEDGCFNSGGALVAEGSRFLGEQCAADEVTGNQ